MSDMPGAPRLAISTVCLSGTLEDKLRAAAAAGFTGVEVLEYDLVMSPWSPRRLADEAAGLGLSIDVYQPFHVETVPPDLFAASLRHAERKFDLLSELGASVLVCCSSRTPRGLDDDDLAAEQLHAMAGRAGAARAAARLRGRAVGTTPHARGCLAHHPASRSRRPRAVPRQLPCSLPGNDPSVIAQVAGDKVFHVQLADAPRLNMDVREWSLHYRMFPGQGSLDVAGFLSQILAMGYDGPMALEVFNDVYQQEDPRHAATDAMRSMLALAEAVGARDSLEVAVEHLVPATCRRLPELGGFAFAELAVDAVSAPARLAHAYRRSASHTSGSTAPSRCSCGSRAAPGFC